MPPSRPGRQFVEASTGERGALIADQSVEERIAPVNSATKPLLTRGSSGDLRLRVLEHLPLLRGGQLSHTPPLGGTAAPACVEVADVMARAFIGSGNRSARVRSASPPWNAATAHRNHVLAVVVPKAGLFQPEGDVEIARSARDSTPTTTIKPGFVTEASKSFGGGTLILKARRRVSRCLAAEGELRPWMRKARARPQNSPGLQCTVTAVVAASADLANASAHRRWMGCPRPPTASYRRAVEN